MEKVSIVVPNWNGADELPSCLKSLENQSQRARIIVVENGSIDDSLQLLRSNYENVDVVELPINRGFAGGVNAGILRAIQNGSEYVALFNNDAIADKSWLKNLVDYLDNNPGVGIAASKIMGNTGEYLDSTGENYTSWGLPYPRGRRETSINKYDEDINIFAASGGASLYRVKMLKQIGLFDEDFFAYYEDVDISFRAQLAGWKVAFVPTAKAYHQIGGTSRRVHGFTTLQTMKNLPWLMWKNIPLRLLPKVFPRFVFAYFAFYFSALTRGEGWAATKGMFISIFKWPKKLTERHRIQKSKKVTDEYIYSLMFHDLPPNAHKLRRLRSMWWKITRRKAAA